MYFELIRDIVFCTMFFIGINWIIEKMNNIEKIED